MAKVRYEWQDTWAPPERPYKTMEVMRREYMQSRPQQLYNQFVDDDKWPCLTCRGYGTIYDPDDPPDPVEGNKNRDRISCTHCAGRGHIPKKEFRKAYRLVIDAYLARKREHRDNYILCIGAMEKLTPEEIAVLGL